MPPSLRVPGDKSVSHRLLLLAAMARGTSRFTGLLTSLDARSSAACLRKLGAGVTSLREGAAVEVRGRGGLRRPSARLDCGNSGTTARLLLGLLAGHRFPATLTGDASLRRRPMRRVTEPLAQMGARFTGSDDDRLPLTVHGGALQPIRWELPVSSAQLKGALLFAGAVAGVPVELREPAGRSRDHTERLLRAHGFEVVEDGAWIRFSPTGRFEPMATDVPGDPSSAAFVVGAGLVGATPVRLEHVGLNPTRTGFLRVLERMAAEVRAEVTGTAAGEPVGEVLARPSQLRGTTVEAEEIPTLIDEVPLLAVLATGADGQSRFREVGELRVKESDRLGLIARNLRAVGAEAAVEGEDLVVAGGMTRPPRGRIETAGDHRLAMAFGVLGRVPGASVEVDDPACVAVSFPGFWAALARADGQAD